LALSIADFRKVYDQLGSSCVVNELGNLALDEGDAPSALDYFREALLARASTGANLEAVESMEGISSVAMTLRQLDLGVTLFASAIAWRQEHGAPLPPQVQDELNCRLDIARADLSPTDFERAWNTGQAKRLDDAVNLALTVSP
jgi:hypothetical protein